jgi:hypothetical protein
MIVKESIAFKRGIGTKSALGIGMKEAYRLDPAKYLSPEMKKYLERNRLYYNGKIDYMSNDTNYHFVTMDKIGDEYEGEFYINMGFTLEIDDYDDRSTFRKSFSKFVNQQANFMVTGWKSSPIKIERQTRETIGKYFTRFEVTIEPREQQEVEY